jgi:hypothetical protein
MEKRGPDMGWSVAALEAIHTSATLTDDVSWLQACAATDGGQSIVLQHGSVALPLCWKKRHGLVVVECLGQENRSAAGPIPADGAAMPPLHHEDLPQKADLIDFRRVPKAHIDSVFPLSPSRLTRFDILHFGRALGENEEAFLATLGKGTRKDLRYAINRVGKTFGQQQVRYQSVPLTQDNWEETWAKAAHFAQHTWQGKANVSVLTNSAKKLFLYNLLKNGMAVTMHSYSFGDDIAAAAITMEKHGQILIYSHEYHADYAKYQPGHILNYNIILDAMANGISVLDFGVGATPHKYEWQCNPDALWRIMVPLTWKGRLAMAYQKTRWRMGAMKNATATQ